MNKELDNALDQLKENIRHFRQAIENFQRADIRLDEMTSELESFRQDLKQIKEVQTPLTLDQNAVKQDLTRMSRDQQSIIDKLDRIDREQQTIIEHVLRLDQDQQNIEESRNSLEGKIDKVLNSHRRLRIIMYVLFFFFMICIAALAHRYLGRLI
jgi:chromosome segregation ATPase